MTDETIVLCDRVVDVPIPHTMAEIRICTGGCLERVWVSATSPKGRPVCMHCGERIVAADPDAHFMQPTAEQMRELRRFFTRSRQ